MQHFLLLTRKFLLLVLLINCRNLFAHIGKSEIDSTKSIKVKNFRAKHYFKTVLFSNFYKNNTRTLGSSNFPVANAVNNKLQTFQYNQINAGFIIPTFTKDKFSKDSSSVKNWHILITGNFLNANPVFSGMTTQYSFGRYGLGFRMMYNNGKKDVFFIDHSSFLISDYSQLDKITFRSSSTFLWSHVFSDKLSFRLGFLRSFIFGDRNFIPMIGFRFGRLDKTYLSFQFPRNLFLNVPLKKSISLNFVFKPVGNIFDYRDRDSIYNGSDKNLIFGWRDLCLGGGFDYHPGNVLSFFIHAGFATANSKLAFYSYSSNQNNKIKSFKWFYNEKLDRTTFINFGLSLKFGSTKISSGNFNLYELKNINSESDPGYSNTGSNNNEIPAAGSEKNPDIKIKELGEIISDFDLYD